jgi:hypothetical protein
MTTGVNIDGVLVTWGDRLFYPGNRMVKGNAPPKLTGDALRRRAREVRRSIAATVRRVPQVMVKVTGGGRGTRAIAAHFRYISKNGRLDIEDDRGEIINGTQAVRDLADDWRFSGGLIPEEAGPGGRREAFNIMLSMPRGTDPLAVQRAAREFALVELAGHKYVMVLHDHQANPHVHISVRAERRDGLRLNPRKVDLHRWREVFAKKLRDLGIEADATRQVARVADRLSTSLWETKARSAGRLRNDHSATRMSSASESNRNAATEAWLRLRAILEESPEHADRQLSAGITEMLQEQIGERRPSRQICPSELPRSAFDTKGAKHSPRRSR